jgi:plasmid segregation protein ParM
MLIALDLGYSHIKGMTDGRRTLFPSILGEVQRSHLNLDLATQRDDLQIETEEGAWLVGQAAMEQSSLETRRLDPGWITTPEYLALMLAAITELTPATGVTVELMTGLPVGDFLNRKTLLERLRGVHQAKRAGRHAQRIEIADLVILPQGLAAVLSEALDDKGHIQPGPVSQGTVGLVDVGGRTVNVATVVELREIARQTLSIDGGMWGPLAEIRRHVNAAFPGLDLRGHEIAEAVKQGIIRHYGEECDISSIAQEALRPFIRQILSVASQVWGSTARLDVLLIAGGGAEIVGPAFLAEYPHTRIIQDPIWANCRGYLRFGRRHWERK